MTGPWAMGYVWACLLRVSAAELAGWETPFGLSRATSGISHDATCHTFSLSRIRSVREWELVNSKQIRTWAVGTKGRALVSSSTSVHFVGASCVDRHLEVPGRGDVERFRCFLCHLHALRVRVLLICRCSIYRDCEIVFPYCMYSVSCSRCKMMRDACLCIKLLHLIFASKSELVLF